jgi:hypothetical protein
VFVNQESDVVPLFTVILKPVIASISESSESAGRPVERRGQRVFELAPLWGQSMRPLNFIII